MRFIDPDGMAPIEPNGGMTYEGYVDVDRNGNVQGGGDGRKKDDEKRTKGGENTLDTQVKRNKNINSQTNDAGVPIGDGGFLFKNEKKAFAYMYSTSFFNSSGEIRELSAWITKDGILVMPYHKNGTNESRNDYYEITTNSDGSKSVSYGGMSSRILGHIHTHPHNYDTGPTLPNGKSQGDFAMYDYINKPIFTIGPKHIYMGIRVDGKPERSVVGSKDEGVFFGSIYNWLD